MQHAEGNGVGKCDGGSSNEDGCRNSGGKDNGNGSIGIGKDGSDSSGDGNGSGNDNGSGDKLQQGQLQKRW
jgi:hypothetical protein